MQVLVKPLKVYGFTDTCIYCILLTIMLVTVILKKKIQNT